MSSCKVKDIDFLFIDIYLTTSQPSQIRLKRSHPTSVMNIQQLCRMSFQLISSGLLIYQLMVAFIKYNSNPTVVTTSVKNIENVTSPTIMVCPLDQADWSAASSIGYSSRSDFFLGRPDSTNKYLSWGGTETLEFDVVKRRVYIANFDLISVDSGLTIDRFILPNGNCKEVRHGNLSLLTVKSKSANVHILITDPAKTLNYKVSTLSMTGDELKLFQDGNNTVNTFFDFFVEMEQVLLDSSKPGQDCTDYGEGKKYESLSHCLEMTLNKQIQTEIGCNIPWMSATNSCIGIINKFYTTTTLEMLNKFRLELLINLDPVGDVCKVPCLSMKINVRKLSYDKSVLGNSSQIQIRFHPTVKVTESVSEYDEWALTVEIGSALGLWLGLSALEIFDFIFDMIKRIVQVCSKMQPK